MLASVSASPGQASSAIALSPSNGLSHERLDRVQDCIEAHLDDRLTLTELAGVACLSSYHFSRSFKQAAGVGPQRYVIQRRLEGAKTLLRRRAASFVDQGHLTSIFYREIGAARGRRVQRARSLAREKAESRPICPR